MDALLASMTTDEFDEWEEYYNLEPWGEERADLRIGLLACAVEKLVAGDKAQWKPEMFLIDPTMKREQQEPDEMAETMRQLAARVNAASQNAGRVILGERL